MEVYVKMEKKHFFPVKLENLFYTLGFMKTQRNLNFLLGGEARE